MSLPSLSSLPQSFKAPRAPRAAKVPRIPKEPKEPKVAKAPKVPRIPKEPKEPKAAKAPRIPKEPKEPKAAKAPRIPKEPKEPKAPKVPRVPKEPKVPRVPKEPKAVKLAISKIESAELLGTGTHDIESPLINISGLTEDDKVFIGGLCGNHSIYGDILIWLRTFNYDAKISPQSCIIVAGPTSIGKTYSINSISKYLNYEIIVIDNNNCYNSQFLKDIIYKSTSSSFIQILTNKFQKKVIIIDNFDSLFISDKTINLTLLKILLENKLKNIPIICISNNDIIKKIGDIKKVCKIYMLATPNNDEITAILQKHEYDACNISTCCINSNGNLDKLFRDIANLNNDRLYSDNVEYASDINILYSNSNSNSNSNSYAGNGFTGNVCAGNVCAGNGFNRQQTKRIIMKDPWMIPLKFHENLIDNLNNRNLSLKEYNEYYKSFMYIMCLYDYYMFKENIEFCVELFASKVYYLSLFKYKDDTASSSNIGNFTKMLSYLSLQKKNIKNNYNVRNKPLYQISNYHISLCNRKIISFN